MIPDSLVVAYLVLLQQVVASPMASPGRQSSLEDSDRCVLLGTCGLLTLPGVFCSTVGGGTPVTLPDFPLWHCHARQLALSHRCHCPSAQPPCEFQFPIGLGSCSLPIWFCLWQALTAQLVLVSFVLGCLLCFLLQASASLANLSAALLCASLSSFWCLVTQLSGW